MHLLAKRFGSSSRWAKASGTLAIALALTLAGCESPEQPTVTAPVGSAPAETSAPAPSPNSTETPVASQTSQVIGEPIVSDHELIPGRHCYSIESDVLTAAIGVTLTEDDRVLGETQGTIHNETAGYFSGYVQTFAGGISQDQLTLDLTSYIEGDVQEAQETWTLGNDQLNTGRDVYDQVDCSVVQEQLAIAFEYGDGAEVPAEGPTVAPVQETSAAVSELTEGANSVRVRRLSFAPGASSAFVEDAVVRGDRDEYLLGAAAGQTMTLSISALEENAVFGVATPDGSVLVTEKTFAELELPQDGDYSIVVGGTRGNASYGLEVEIR